MVTVKCANCGKEIETYPSRIKRNEERNCKFYCSSECKAAYWARHRTGENNPKSKPKIIVKCAWCGKDILLPSWRVKKSVRHFCNAECRGKWQSEHKKGPSSPHYKKESHVLTKCDYCGKSFKIRAGQYKRYKKHHCSMDCCDKAKIGKKHPERRAELHEYVCPICGKVFFQNKNAKRQRKTCSRECGYIMRGKSTYNRVRLICQYCGKEYVVPNCEKERSKYCSRSCLALAKLVDGHSNTLPERLTADKLTKLGIKFIPQYPIDRMKVDFYLTETNTVLEVYGDYWHGNPIKYPKKSMLNKTQIQNMNRDRKRKHFLIKSGYRFVYIWETQIKENPDILVELLNMN